MKGINKKVTFEDMPELVSSLLTEVKTLQGKVDSVSNLVKTITPKDDVKILTVDDVCRWLGKSKSSVYKMTSRGEIPCYKQGRIVTFIESEFIGWLTAYKKGSCVDMMSRAEEYIQRMH